MFVVEYDIREITTFFNCIHYQIKRWSIFLSFIDLQSKTVNVCVVAGDELWYYGKMSRQKCEELMLRVCDEDTFLAFYFLTSIPVSK